MFFCLSCILHKTLSPCLVSDGAAFSVGSQFEYTVCFIWEEEEEISFGGQEIGGHHSIETFVFRSQSSIWAAEDVQ